MQEANVQLAVGEMDSLRHLETPVDILQYSSGPEGFVVSVAAAEVVD